MIIKSKSEDIEIPDISLAAFVLQQADRFADKTALTDGLTGRSYSYGQFGRLVRNFAANIAARGLEKGDTFALYCPNLPEYAIAFMGIVLAGGRVTTVNPLYTPEELNKQLQDSSAQWLLTVEQFGDDALTAARGTKVKEVFSVDGGAGLVSLSELLVDNSKVPNITIDPANDVVVIPYSSGTTGFRKGVMLTHRNIVANSIQLAALDGYVANTPDDVVLAVLPFFHIYGMVVIMIDALVSGSSIITMPRFDMEKFLSVAEKYRVTRVSLVPPIIVGLTKHPAVDKHDLSSIKYINSGAAPLGEEVAIACAKRLDCLVTQGYGLTETSPVTHSSPYQPDKIKYGSVGLALPNTEMKIVDIDTGVSLGPNKKGEIHIRGPQVMKGYLNNDAATRATVDRDGWLRTGDIGYFDDDQYMFVIDRLKELIKYKGFQVAPAELEAILLSHESIADAAVIPVPDEEAGEVPKAYVVLQGELSASAIQQYVAEKVAPYKKLRQVEICQSIPKSLSGKILRRVLVEREREKMQSA